MTEIEIASEGGARILDRGYRRYDGPRRGTGGAIRSLIAQTLQRALGIRRGAWAKAWPLAVIAMSYIPAIVFIGITVLAKQQDPDRPQRFQVLLPTYGQYYGFVTAAIVLFTAFVAPEVLCTDRRTRMLGLYLASPLNRTTYLLSKAASVGIALSIVTIGPPLLMVVAFTLNGFGPSGFAGFSSLLWRVLLAGAAVAALHTALSLAVASVTERKGAAIAAIIVILLGSSVLSDIVVQQGRGNTSYFLLNLLLMPFELVLRIYNDPTHVPRYARGVSTGAIVAAYVGWTLLFSVFVWWRYRRVEVTR